jgi:hypothetical protein
MTTIVLELSSTCMHFPLSSVPRISITDNYSFHLNTITVCFQYLHIPTLYLTFSEPALYETLSGGRVTC